MGSFSTVVAKTTPEEIWAYVPRKITYDRVVINVTPKTPVETLQATPTSLPTAKPATPQKSLTIASTDLPSVDVTPESVKYMMVLYLGGKNTDTVAQTVYVDVHLNGSLVISNSASVGAGYYWTLSAFVTDVKVGDVIDIYIWASAVTVNWDYDSHAVQICEIGYALNSVIIDLCYWYTDTGVGLSLGTPGGVTIKYLDVYTQDSYIVAGNSSSGRLNLLYPVTFLVRTYYGGTYRNYSTFATSTTYRPYAYFQGNIGRLMLVV